jgi:hypothetical protein
MPHKLVGTNLIHPITGALVLLALFQGPVVGQSQHRRKASDLPSEVRWNVMPDPGERSGGPINLQGSIVVRFQGEFLFPSTASTFVAATPPKTKNLYQVYNLRTMRPVGKPVIIANRFAGYCKPALAPDGRYVAARVKEGATSTVEVWSVATGQSVLKLRPEDDPEIKPRHVDLLGDDRLWVAAHRAESPDWGEETTFRVWDIRSAKEIVRFTNPLVPHGDWITFSQGRRYQFMEQTDRRFRFLVWDLTTGELVGEREFQPREAPWGQAAGLAFSPDGEEMAMLWRLGRKPDTWGRLLVFETRTGNRLYDHRIGYDPPSIDSLWFDGGMRGLQWWPVRRGWLLFGHLLIDRETGAIVLKIGAAPGSNGAIKHRRFLDDYHITTVEGTFDRQITVVALPREKIDAAITKARAGKQTRTEKKLDDEPHSSSVERE